MAFDPVSIALEVGGKLIDHFFPNAADQAAAKLKLFELQQSGALAELAAETSLTQAQIDVNKAEAGNASVFVAGWRPFVGWVCGLAFAYKFIIVEFLSFGVYLWATPETIAKFSKLPVLDYSDLLPVLFGMLGLGAMRSYDKLKGNGNETGKH